MTYIRLDQYPPFTTDVFRFNADGDLYRLRTVNTIPVTGRDMRYLQQQSRGDHVLYQPIKYYY